MHLNDNFQTDVAAIQGIAAVSHILDVACRMTGMGFAAVARGIGNALDHGAADAPVEVEASTNSGGLELSLTNSGDPIPPSDIERIFQPFKRDRSRTKREGLGLGLFIAAEIARAHGGSLAVSSTPEKTRFNFIMPLK